MFSFHLIIFEYNRSSIETPDRLFSMIDYEKSNNGLRMNTAQVVTDITCQHMYGLFNMF